MGAVSHTLWIGLLVIILSALVTLFTPKFYSRQIFVATVVMSLICCYLLWALVYVSQIHLFITPIHRLHH